MLTFVWRDGKSRITTDNAYLEISNRVQTRFTYDDRSSNTTALAGTAAPGDPLSSFRIRRAKFKLEGWMIKTWLTYETQMNWPAISTANLGAFVEDAAFDIDFSKGKGLFRAHIGQFKPPFGAQELTSSGSQQFVDRALTFNPRRNRELLRRSLLHNLRQMPDGRWMWKYDQRHRGKVDPGAYARRRELLWAAVDAVECPTLVVRGAESDVFHDEDAEKMVARFRRARWVKVPGAGHTVQGDNPGGLLRELRPFLDEVAPGR